MNTLNFVTEEEGNIQQGSALICPRSQIMVFGIFNEKYK